MEPLRRHWTQDDFDHLVTKVMQTVQSYIGDVVSEETPEDTAREECWTLAIDDANSRIADRDLAIKVAKEVCHQMGYTPKGYRPKKKEAPTPVWPPRAAPDQYSRKKEEPASKLPPSTGVHHGAYRPDVPMLRKEAVEVVEELLGEESDPTSLSPADLGELLFRTDILDAAFTRKTARGYEYVALSSGDGARQKPSVFFIYVSDDGTHAVTKAHTFSYDDAEGEFDRIKQSFEDLKREYDWAQKHPIVPAEKKYRERYPAQNPHVIRNSYGHQFSQDIGGSSSNYR